MVKGKIKSDGGSSSYYDRPISERLVQKINQRYECGQPFIKTEEIIQELFDNDFDAGSEGGRGGPMKESTMQGKDEKPKKIKSDGGSSAYYDLNIPKWLLHNLNERQKEGNCYIKTEEIINAFFGNDFSFGTAMKSLVRAWGLKKGAGKEGNDIDYEVNKIIYYAEQIREMQNGSKTN